MIPEGGNERMSLKGDPGVPAFLCFLPMATEAREQLTKRPRKYSEMRDQNTMLQLQWALQALAIPADQQLRLFPDFTWKSDELVDDFAQWHRKVIESGNHGFTPDALSALAKIDALFERMPPERFTGEAVLEGGDWEELRVLAGAALYLLEWAIEPPPYGRSLYVGPPGSNP
ncbi:MAG: uncharacterized protein JWM59_4293 [Verrucomicrobiales bacterium]|nr:uncharacterized protein [Verrucomicrobiales bacterium]